MVTTSNPTGYYPPQWRSEAVRPLVRYLGQGECISLIGVGTVGKTHFLRFLQRDDVMEYHLSRLYPAGNRPFDTSSILFIPVDPNNLLDMEAAPPPHSWAGFELIAASIYNYVKDHQVLSEADVSAMFKVYRDGLLQSDPMLRRMAFRHVEELIEKLFAKTSYQKIILLFDEFERIYKQMPATFFVNLRGLRDRYRYRLLYLTTTRIELNRIDLQETPRRNGTLITKFHEVESFLEIFKHPVYLGAAHGRDYQQLFDVLYNRLCPAYPISPAIRTTLEYLSGGHAGLLRTLLRSLESLPPGQDYQTDYLHDYFMGIPGVRQECAIMLRSFSYHERHLCGRIVAHGSYRQLPDTPSPEEQAAAGTLFNKRVLRVASNDWIIAPPLLVTCVHQEGIEDPAIYSDDALDVPQAANPPQDNSPPRPNSLPD